MFLEPQANFYAYLKSTRGGAYACIQASIMHFQRAYKYSNAMLDNDTDAYIIVRAVLLSTVIVPHPTPTLSSSTYE